MEYSFGLAHLFACLSHYVVAAIVLAENISWDSPVHLSFNIWTPLNGTDSCGEGICYTEPVYWNLKSNEKLAGIVVSMFSFISGTNHLLSAIAFLSDNSSLKLLVLGPEKKGPNVIRSIDWGLSAPLMIVINLFLYRIPADLLALTGYALLTAMTIFVGYGYDLAQANNVRYGLGVGGFVLVGILYVASWIPLFFIFPGSVQDPRPSFVEGLYYNNGTAYLSPSTRDPPPQVYVFIFYLFGSFLVFPVVQLYKVLRFNPGEAGAERRYIKYEFYYIFLSAFSKIPLLLLFYGGVKGRQNTSIDREAAFNQERTETDFTDLGIGFAIVGVLGLILWRLYSRSRSEPEVTPVTASVLNPGFLRVFSRNALL